MHDPFDRRIGFGSVALVIERLKNDMICRKPIKPYLDEFLKEKGYFQTEKFLWVGLMYLYGTKNNLKVEFQGINKKWGDLSIAVELDTKILEWADKHNLELMHDIFMIAALEALIQVCDKYKLEKDVLLQERSKYGAIPNSVEECEAYKRP